MTREIFSGTLAEWGAAAIIMGSGAEASVQEPIPIVSIEKKNENPLEKYAHIFNAYEWQMSFDTVVSDVPYTSKPGVERRLRRSKWNRSFQGFTDEHRENYDANRITGYEAGQAELGVLKDRKQTRLDARNRIQRQGLGASYDSHVQTADRNAPDASEYDATNADFQIDYGNEDARPIVLDTDCTAREIAIVALVEEALKTFSYNGSRKPIVFRNENEIASSGFDPGQAVEFASGYGNVFRGEPQNSRRALQGANFSSSEEEANWVEYGMRLEALADKILDGTMDRAQVLVPLQNITL